MPKQKRTPSPNRKPYMVIKNVQPLRNAAAIENMKWALKRFCTERDYILFLLGINTGLRCGDLLKLSIAEVQAKREFKIQEGKTGKPRTIYLHNIYDDVQAYIMKLKIEGKSKWLFPSRKGGEPITVTQAYRQLNKAADMADVEYIGTHSMRKTHAYFMYKQTKNPALIMEILNHSSWAISKRYIGITDEEVNEVYQGFKL